MQIALWIDTPALGDTIAAIPTLRKLVQAYGQPLTVFTSKPFLFENHPLVKQALPSDADKSDYKVYRTFSPLVGKQYQLQDQQVEFRYSNMDLRQFHAVSLGFTLTEAEMEMDLYIERPRELDGIEDYVIIHPTHTWPTRTWDQEKWQELIDRLNERGIPVVAVGRDAAETGFFNTQKPVMPINIKLGVNLLNDPNNDPAELRWMMNHRARAVVTMDSGMLHIAGTTDVNIIQLGSSIDNKLRAPYRKGSQDYKYNFVRGGCDLFCSSNQASNIKVHGSIHGVPPQVKCLENKPTFECHPTVDQVFEAVVQLYDVKPKIKIVHLLLNDDSSPERQFRSIESIQPLAARGIEYVQIWNDRYKGPVPLENYADQANLDKVREGHYGNFRAFADAAIQHYTEDLDALIFCEGDAVLTQSVQKTVDAINKAYDECIDKNIAYFSFGARYHLEFGNMESVTWQQHGELHIVNKVIGAQMVMVPKAYRSFLIDRFKHHVWTSADMFVNNIFTHKFNIGIFENPYAVQFNGVSAIDGWEKIHIDTVAQAPQSKIKLLYLAPHLSTGGMPEFLLGRIKALINEPMFDIHVVEYALYAETYTVQRDQIQALLPKGNFHQIGHLGLPAAEREARLKEIILALQPQIIHIEESPEAFDSFNKMSAQTQEWLYQSSNPWKIVETCHNIWFNPREHKRISPDAYLFVTPHHMLETFSEEPSEKFEALFPIIPQTKSETQRRKSLEILGLEHLSNAKHLVNIGLWTPGKNQAEAVRWARTLEALYPGQYQFHFVGNQASNFQDYWQPIMATLPSNVHIWGERNDVDTFYQLADAVVFNSTWECNPLALRQALGYPLPVMARNLPQYHSMYTDSITHIQGDSTDPLRLVEMLQNPIQRKQNPEAMAQFKQEHIDAYLKTLQGPVKRATHSRDEYTVTWHNGPKVTSQTGRELKVQFLADGKTVYSHTLSGVGHWCRPSDEWYRDWTVLVNGLEHRLELAGGRAMVQFDSSSLGDTLSWIEPCVAFKNQHGLEVLYLATHKNWLFDQDHYRAQGIEFIAPGEWPQDAIAKWNIGVHMQDPPGQAWFPHKNKRDWRKIYLGDIASDHLGVATVTKAPKLQYTGQHQQDRPYICIATQSTAQAKYWNNPTGWQELIDHYTAKGYDVYHLSKEGNNNLTGYIQAAEDLAEVYKLLQGAERFYGISSGLSWFAWATDVPITLISGFTPEECEFLDDRTVRVINKSVCNSCWAWDHFNRGDWHWCPSHKGTDRHYECTKQISLADVLEAETKHNNK